MDNKNMKSGVIRCQKCLRYGHYSFQCPNPKTYLYRPSRTVIYTQNINIKVEGKKLPKLTKRERSRFRNVLKDQPSSSSEQQKNIEIKETIKKSNKEQIIQNKNKQLKNMRQNQSLSSDYLQSSQSDSNKKQKKIQIKQKKKSTR